MSRVLLTGGAGYFGSHRGKALAGAGFKLIAFDSSATCRAYRARASMLKAVESEGKLG